MSYDIRAQQLRAAHHPTIADRLGDAVAEEGSLWIDSDFFVWQISRYHSGFILNSINSEAHIPYWASYKLNRPDLKPFYGDAKYITPVINTSKTIAAIMEASGVCDGYRYIDAAQIEWNAHKCQAGEGYQLEQCADNAWLPWKTCKLISIPGFRLLATTDQLDARMGEWYK